MRSVGRDRRDGNAFIMVIAVLGVIFVASTFFMSSTIEMGRHTEMSMRGVQSYSLAEAALERALHIIQRELNDPAVFSATTGKADSVAVRLRMPLRKAGANMSGLSDSLGRDEMLDLAGAPDLVKGEVILTEDQLRLKPKGEDELDKLVAFMTDGKAVDFKLEVKVKLEKAFRITPGKDYADYKVPGVDLGWMMRPDVKRFLEGQGYTAFHLEFPQNFSLFQFEIPIKIMGIDLVKIDVPTLLDPLVKNFTPPNPHRPGQNWGIKDLFSVDIAARELFKLIGMADKYPLKLTFDKVSFPQKHELWPTGTNVNAAGYDQHLEKYGEMRFTSDATIIMGNGYKSNRRIEATKEFKVADVEPPAPMYSFFVANLANDYLAFNNFGGQFFVNNCDLGGIWNKVKGAVVGTQNVPADQIEKFEIPGLIRVNYKGDYPMVVNIGMLGPWGSGAPPIYANDTGATGGMKNLLYGAEWLLLLAPKTSMAASARSYNVEMDTKPSTTWASVPGSDQKVPQLAWGTGNVKTSTSQANFKSAYTTKPAAPDATPEQIAAANKAAFWQKVSAGCNFIPNVAKMDVNVIQLGISLAIRNPFYSLDGTVPGVGLYNAFQGWEMPYMGVGFDLYTIPTLGWGSNKTHLFGLGAMHPTLTREVEGLVGKQYRKWNMCIVGMSQLNRLPLLPFPPPWCFVPPIPIPMWYTETIVKKYDYNLDCLKSLDSSANKVVTQMTTYDPELVVNYAPNLYSVEQYAKKANYYYKTTAEFLTDLPHRMTAQTQFGPALVLNGVTYISDSLGTPNAPFKPYDKDGNPLDTLYVIGKGMIVCSGNVMLGCDIKVVDPDKATTDPSYKTVFSLIVRSGGLAIVTSGKGFTIEGSLYTDKGLYVCGGSSLHIIGNWVTNKFSKDRMLGNVTIDYVSSRVRTALGSLHPEYGRYDPRRYQASISPTWTSWKAN